MCHHVYPKSGCFEVRVFILVATCVGSDYLGNNTIRVRHPIVGFILEILMSRWGFGSCLDGDYWLLVVF